MTGISAVGVNDDLTSRKSRIALRTARYKAACRIDKNLSVLVNKIGVNRRSDNLFNDILTDLIEFNICAVL